MADKKNIVIKVKYPTATASDQITPATITTWNKPRIGIAIALLFVILSGLFYFFSNGQSPDNQQIVVEPAITANKPPINQPMPVSVNAGAEPIAHPGAPAETVTSHESLDKPENASESQVWLDEAPKKAALTSRAEKPAIHSVRNKKSIKKKPAAENKMKGVALDPDKHISRAVLAQKLSDKEPVHEITGAITASNSKPATVFYFTELRNMNGQKIYHEWFHNGKLVARYELLVAADRWRTSSHRLLSSKARGEWSVKLIDENYKLLNQKIFIVN